MPLVRSIIRIVVLEIDGCSVLCYRLVGRAGVLSVDISGYHNSVVCRVHVSLY